MRFKVRHRTRYTYNRRVFLEPQTIRLRPRGEASQRIVRFDLAIEPAPAGQVTCLDPEGNDVVCAWFNDLTRTLTITTCFEVKTLRSNPYDFILTEPGTQVLPAAYSPDLAARLTGCLTASAGDSVAAFAREAAVEAGGRTMEFLGLLCDRIYRRCAAAVRLDGPPLPAEQTLNDARGSCRDLAVLFIEACRCQGLAARFVSGYQQGDPEAPERHLHAWAEVYLPGGGWRGFDPTHGLTVSDRHVAVAASMTPAGAAPLAGAFRGHGVTTALDYSLQIQVTAD